MFRLVGALFVMAGTGGFGYLIACGLTDRAVMLEHLAAALQHLETEINFAASPLPAALQHVAGVVGGPVGGFFTAVAQEIAAGDGRPLAAAWRTAMARRRWELPLLPAEAEVLARLGAVLGGSDRQDQLKHLTLARATIARFHAEAEEKARKNRRVWQYLGFSFGALLVMLLY